ncbi:MAG: hypothetical protein RL095_3372 [Verrucomicrobiota bacterium]|jgi:hypothetical protein
MNRFLIALATSAFLAACGEQKEIPAQPVEAAHSHDHSQQGHDHGAHHHADGKPCPGCAAAAKVKAAHDHKPQRGGVLVELGEEVAQIELVLDAAAGSLTAYVLTGCADKPQRLKQTEIKIKTASGELVLAGQVSELSGEKLGDTSVFALNSPVLKGLASLKGQILSVDIAGLPFEGVPFEVTAKKGG